MAPTSNKSFVFKQVPTGLPVPGQDLTIEDRPIDLDAPLDGGILIKVLYSSFDPYMRGRMRPAEAGKSYIPPFPIDQTIASSIVARVERSDTAQFAAGDLVTSFMGPNSEYAAIPAKFLPGFFKVPNTHNVDLPLFVGALGMPGMTAYEGLYEIGKPQRGETIFVSSAAGAVGQIVGQLAKAEGVKVIGSVGSDEKLDFILNELGFDAGFNYKKESPSDALKRLAPNGIDMYFENVGGDHLEAALEAFNPKGRIIGCGMISDYNTPRDQQKGVRGLFHVVAKKITFQGFLVDLSPEKYKPFQEKVQPMIAKGDLKVKIHLTDSIDKAADGFVGMLTGQNFGKAVLKIAQDA
ncbi:NADP-dependent oxidoreductase RED1 [Colletotrichum orbiculare MAFF 240422]|uniref:Dehydrogenase FUB6 n=1 Tax=Colletotrichum orbiculare (strain 104-T / ATCC 96160 / CBS 514.97 / LARS 414 / MAFF 240422) TaxID=1213857 RepID=N4VNL5_COLOR|nr:NADP-dependent oxidoreductase RED1 [Colletotrichum orbiculare MAFF 240422]